MADGAFRITLPEGIETPSVVVDVDVAEHNITSWAQRFADRGVGIRPHTKTSKCLPIIERQVAAGCVGLTIATLGEGEVLADAGFTELFQAYPLWAGHPDRARRLRALHDRTHLMIGLESVESAAALGAAMRGATRPGSGARGSAAPLEVLIEIDPGLHRSGVLPADALAIARAAEAAGLLVRGAFTFGGHGYANCDAAPAAGDDEVNCLTATAEALHAAGFDTTVLSAGSTPTATHSARPPVTDERPGTYVFHDNQQVTLGVAGLDEVALCVAATVVASHSDGRFVLDSGSKALASDRPAWVSGHGSLPAHPAAVIRAISEHHAVVIANGPQPRVGDVVAVVPNHCCTVVNLVDELVAVRNGEVVDRWPVSSRGRNN